MHKKIIVMSISMAVIKIASAIDILNPADAISSAANTVSAAEIPSGDKGRAYIPGSAATNDSIVSTTYSNTFKMGAGYNLSLDRQCGSLNPFENMSGQLEAKVQEKADELQTFAVSLPSQLANSAVEYTLAKVNPTLYQLFQLNLDEYFELFNINVKSCEDIQNELSNNPNADPYNQLMQIAIADRWSYTIGSGQFVNDYHQKQKLEQEAKEEGITMADGKQYGGKNQDPINYVKSMATAGINSLLGRTDTSKWSGDFDSSQKASSPILKYFNNADELINFVENIYGSEEIRLYGEDQVNHTVTKAGVGIGQEYNRIRNRNLIALRAYMKRQMSREDFEEKTLILMPPAEMDDIRLADSYQQAALLEDKAKQTAIDELTTKLKLAKDALNAGAKAPELVQSKLATMAENRQNRLNYRILDDIAALDNSRY